MNVIFISLIKLKIFMNLQKINLWLWKRITFTAIDAALQFVFLWGFCSDYLQMIWGNRKSTKDVVCM